MALCQVDIVKSGYTGSAADTAESCIDTEVESALIPEQVANA